MVKAKRIGIVVFLMGICFLIISFAFISGYDNKLGLLGSVTNMEIVIKGVTPQPRLEKPAEAPAPAPEAPAGTNPPGRSRNEFRDLIPRTKQDREHVNIYADIPYTVSPHPKGRIAIPFKYFFAINMIIIFLGLTIMILSKTNTKE